MNLLEITYRVIEILDESRPIFTPEDIERYIAKALEDVRSGKLT